MERERDAKYFLNVFPGQKAQITDCQVRKQLTLTFTHEHTFIRLLYKCLLITHQAPGAGDSAVSTGRRHPGSPASLLTCGHATKPPMGAHGGKCLHSGGDLLPACRRWGADSLPPWLSQSSPLSEANIGTQLT